MKRCFLFLACALSLPGCIATHSTHGPVILSGGGREGDTGDNTTWSARLYRHFLDGGDLTGDGRITIAVLSYRTQSQAFPDYLKSLGAYDAINFALDTTVAADDPALDARFATIDAVFIKGGDQGRYYDLWNDRRIERLVRDLWHRGGAVGGTSAGAMALAEFALTGSKSLTSRHVLADSHTPWLDDESDGGSGIHRDILNFVPGVVIDSHFTQRNRFGRLVGTCVKACDDFKLASIRGIGLDERTGVVIRGNWAECIGVGTVTVLTATPASSLQRPQGRPPVRTNVRFDQLADGWHANLSTGAIRPPVIPSPSGRGPG